MQTAEARPAPEFVGSEQDREIAADIFNVMRGMGRFFARGAPIRVPVEQLASYLASRRGERPAGEWAGEIERIASANSAVFALVEENGQRLVATTVDGRRPEPAPADAAHTLARRFQDPAKIQPGESPTERAERRRQATSTAEVEKGMAPAAAPPPPAAQPDLLEEIEELEAPAAAAAPVGTVIAEPAELDDDVLADVIAAHLRAEVTVASFGNQWMALDKTPDLSRGDLRRIREYILERGEPLTDDILMQDVLGLRPNADDYELRRFALNYRLSREAREFEFVGTPRSRLWSTTGLPTIGATRRKASDIGQEYRFLLQDRPVELHREETVAEHVLTYYEYYLGVLPYDATFEALLPPPVLPDQRAAVLTIEAPQTFETFQVELRYPTGNRGGYIAGFERFFSENLVAGALITLERGETDGRYLLEYLQVSGEDEKLLHLDEKKGRLVFRPTTFYCATQANMLLTENRYPRLANATLMDDRSRRRPELALAVTFERVGDEEGSGDDKRYMAMLDELLAPANIERPMSASLIQRLVDSDQYPQFTRDPEVEDVLYYYDEPSRAQP